MESSAHDDYKPPANQAPRKLLTCRVEPSPEKSPQENISFDCEKR